jgi:RsiW-degrading membrane proteinase PrsW (M82 family)
MSFDVLLHVFVGVAPVLCFLGALLYLDSYKLVSLRAVVTVVFCGLIVALACYAVNAWLLSVTAINLDAFKRYVGPVVEELFKALVIVALMRMHRIGFLVDAAIFGFAVGTGFAIVENLYYQHLVPDAGIGIWIVRGFGTAIMHGGATAIFAVMGLALRERTQWPTPVAFAPGFLLAVILHSAFNHMYLPPQYTTLAVLLVLPPLALRRLQTERPGSRRLARPGIRRRREHAGIDQLGTVFQFADRTLPTHAERPVPWTCRRGSPLLRPFAY